MAEPAQLQFTSPVMVTIDFKLDLMWPSERIVEHVAAHLISSIADVLQWVAQAWSEA